MAAFGDLADRGTRFAFGRALALASDVSSAVTCPERRATSFSALLPLFLQRLAARFQGLHRVTIAPFGRFVVVLPLLRLLPGAVDFLVCPVLDTSDMRGGALRFLLRGGKGCLLAPEQVREAISSRQPSLKSTAFCASDALWVGSRRRPTPDNLT